MTGDAPGEVAATVAGSRTLEPMVDGAQVSEERLRQLLAQGESELLDFKETYDLTDREQQVKVARHLAGLSARGGHLIVGVKEDGTSSPRFSDTLASHFDEATLSAKIRGYVEVDIVSAVHEIDGGPVAIVYVAAHSNGFAVMKKAGTYALSGGSGKQDKAFDAGEVFVRRGTATVRWSPEEAHAAVERAMASRREAWRAEFRADMEATGVLGQQARQISEAPAGAFTWQLDNTGFAATLIELLRRNDDIPIKLALEQIARNASTAVASGDRDTLDTILDRLATAGAVALRVDRQQLFADVVAALVAVYNLGTDPSTGYPRTELGAIPPAQLWLDTISRVFALGALAVRKQAWNAVHALIAQRPAGRENDYYSAWLRHALTMAARAGLLNTDSGTRGGEVSLLEFPREVVNRLPELRPDMREDDQRILNSLTQFDLLGCVGSMVEWDELDDNVWYPNFSRYNWPRAEPALQLLIDDPNARRSIAPVDDARLAQMIREISHFAGREGLRYAVLPGWNSDTVERFLADHPAEDTG